MTATLTLRHTPMRDGGFDDLKMDAVLIRGGWIVCIGATGYATPGVTATGLIAWGIASEEVDNSGGSAGDLKITVETSRGKKDFFFLNDTGTPLTQADVGNDCYILDNQTATGDSTGRSVLGTLMEVTSSGVWVRFKQ